MKELYSFPIKRKVKQKVSVEKENAKGEIVETSKIKTKTISNRVVFAKPSFAEIENALNISISASKKGFDWPDYASCFNKVEEEVKELKMAIENKDSENIKEEYGDLLLALINFARLKELDISASIDLATLKFEKRFKKLRSLAKKRKINLKSAPDLVKKNLWNDSK